MRWTVLLTLLFAACGSQERQEYDPWEDYEPGATYYDRDYQPRNTVDVIVSRAVEAERTGRDDQARVEYHQAFRRDRWHVRGNTRYQDLMLRNELGTTLWQEYLDLWEANQGRGDALWFHLRSEILARQGKSLPSRGKPLTEAERETLATFEADGVSYADIARALETHNWPQLHRLAIAACPDEQLASLVQRYAARADEDPSDGDALALHALAVARTDADDALRMLRDAYVLGLPGYWLYRTLAEICETLGTALAATDLDERRQAAGWLRAAEALYEYCAGAPDDSVTQALARARVRIDELEARGLDGQA